MRLRALLALSVLAGIQRVVQAPKDFKVEKMTGDIKPGGALSGKIAGNLARRHLRSTSN